MLRAAAIVTFVLGGAAVPSSALAQSRSHTLLAAALAPATPGALGTAVTAAPSPRLWPLTVPAMAELAAAAHAADEASDALHDRRGTLTFVADRAEVSYHVTVVRGWREIATCETPCTLTLPEGHYAARASRKLSNTVLRASVELHGHEAKRVRFGVEQWLEAQAGLMLTLAGVGAASMAVDHLSFAPYARDHSAQPMASWLITDLNRDLAVAMGVGMVPAAIGLVSSGMSLTADSYDRGVRVESRRREPRLGISGTNGQYLRGGGILGLEIEYSGP